MKTLLILGAGTGGTMVANKMAQKLDPRKWNIIIVDKDESHYYQPGFLFVPFGYSTPENLTKKKKRFIPPQAELIISDIEIIQPEKDQVVLSNKRTIEYDQLVIATGSHIRPDEIEGMLDGGGWQNNIFDFYTIDGADKLGQHLNKFEGGRLVLNIAEMPIKCPIAPLEFIFLADDYFREKGLRDKVDLVFTTPLSGAFTKPIASASLGSLLKDKGIHIETDFNIAQVDAGKNQISSWDERKIDYDLLVTIPTNMGAEIIGRSEMGDELNYVPTNKHTLQSDNWENVWIIGDAGNLPTSKAGSVAHFMLETITDNIFRAIAGFDPLPTFDGHANCFIETGHSKGILIDFNYETEPLTGTYPLAGVGPFSLLKETRLNHLGKISFEWVYWNLMLKGKHIPVPNQMSMSGKILQSN
ncbi:MAG: NAD(P)/FAD-dependent oxidoreductase [Chloroflexota bacterium]